MHPARRLTLLALSLGLLAAGHFTAVLPPAAACGGFFCSQAPVDQAAERILFASDGDTQISHVQIQYTGDAKKFAWVIPMPSPPKLSVGSDALFTLLRSATRPQFNLRMLETNGTCSSSFFPSTGATPSPAATATPTSSVTVISQEQVGPFDSAVIQSDDPTALKKWLRDNGYDIPQNVDPLLDPYVAGKSYFLAMKLLKDRTAGDLQPIVMKYKADKPGIPIRLTAVAANPDMDVQVWMLGKHRAVPENYKHVEINEARINWFSNGLNYRQVVTDAVDEAGGLAFVTDYAGDSSIVSMNAFDSSPLQVELASIRVAVDPVTFSRAVRRSFLLLPTSSQQNAFLLRYIPKPASLADVDDTTFLANLEIYAGVKALGLKDLRIDTAKAAAELEETVLNPARDIRELFAKNPYLTNFYTTISPEEMTVDPTFVYNPDLPKVSNMREAKGVRMCSPKVSIFDAPVHITLANGLTFNSSQFGNDPTTPAAFRIEQLASSGAPTIILDNGPVIRKAVGVAAPSGQDNPLTVTPSSAPQTQPVLDLKPSAGLPSPGGSLAPNAGFGCSACSPTNGPPPPIRQGAAEGVTYGAFFLGWIGWRRIRRGR